MSGNRQLSADEYQRVVDDKLVIEILTQAREQPGRMPYEAASIDRHIDRIHRARSAPRLDTLEYRT